MTRTRDRRFFRIALCLLSAMLFMPAYASGESGPEIRYVELPPRLDPEGLHKRYPIPVGSLVFFRQNVRVVESSVNEKGQKFESVRSIDAASKFTRLPHETLVEEPNGTTLHLAPDAIIDRSEPSRNYSVVVVLPGRPIPPYLRSVTPDLVVR
jgi:hypothetical protein